MKKKNEEITLSYEQISKENEKFRSQNLNQNKIDLKSIMQTIYNECPILDHEDSQNIIDKFKMIGPFNIDDEIKKSDLEISFDEKNYKIGCI